MVYEPRLITGIALASLLTLASCATPIDYFQQAPASSSTASTIMESKSPDLQGQTSDLRVYVRKVDGKYVERSYFSGGQPVHIPAGDHDITIAAGMTFRHGILGLGRTENIDGDVTMHAKLKAGTTYTVRSDYVGDRFNVKVWLEESGGTLASDKVDLHMQAWMPQQEYYPVIIVK